MRCLIFTVFLSMLVGSAAYAQTFTITPNIIETSHHAVPVFQVTRTDDEVLDTMSIGRCEYEIPDTTPIDFDLAVIVQDGALDDIVYDYPICITDGATGERHCSILRYNPAAQSAGTHPSDIGMYLFGDCRNTHRLYMPAFLVSIP